MPAAAQISGDSIALRAAVVSFGKKLPPSDAKSHARQGSIYTPEPLSPTTQQSAGTLSKTRNFTDISPSPKNPTPSQSLSRMAASIVFERSSPRMSPSNEQDAACQVGPSVRLRRTLLRGGSDDKRAPCLEKGNVDSSSLDDISSLKSMFECNSSPQKLQTPKKSQSPAIHSPTASNPSLAAAILATHLSPSGSSLDLRRVGPNRAAPPSPNRRSSMHRKSQSESGPNLYPPPPPVRKKSSALCSKSSRESLASRVSSTDVRASALTAATIAHASSVRASPQTIGTQPQKAPQPPPPLKPKSLPTDRPSLSPKSSITSLDPKRTGDSAIAASLAPSRAKTPGPRKPPVVPPPPPRRRRSLPTLPKAALKETLRPFKKERSPSLKPPRGRIPLPRRNSHHAEALKHQWRWHITPKERRRYEGLWAANKGLFLPLREKEYVANVVVRDIWRRSRLDFRTLGEIWELVDRGQKAALSREEFVVGIWLVDMALRGRKVPVRVEDSVWDGVRSAGVVLPPLKDKGKGRR